jgi:hypothetical protein
VKARARKPPSKGATFGTPKRRINVGHVLAALLFLALLLWNVARPDPSWIEEHYSRRFYQMIAGLLVPVTNSVPFSVSAILLMLLPIVWLVWTVWSFRKRRFLIWFWRTLLLAAILYGIFTVNWGINYQRESIETQLGLSTNFFATADLQMLVDTLGEIIEDNAELRSLKRSKRLRV